VNMRDGQDRVVKGYTADGFKDAWARYLPDAATTAGTPSDLDGGC